MRFLRLSVAVSLGLTALFTTVSVRGYDAAVTTHGTAFAVVSTDAAALELSPGAGGGNAANTASLAAGSLVLDFRKGYLGSAGYGFAPPAGSAAGDAYRFRALFKVKNSSASTQCVTVHVPGGGVTGLEAVYGRLESSPSGDGTQLAGAGGTQAGCHSLLVGEVLLVDFRWRITNSNPASSPFTVRVDGQR